jgi:hypothetical protein
MKTCQSKFAIENNFHQKNRKATYASFEHGGNVILDYDNYEILPGQKETGGYNYVQMPRGIVDWHSHPRKCKNKNMCAVGLPSPADMTNIVLGILHGSQAHLVYSAEGTYSVRLKPSLIKKIEFSPRKIKAFCFYVNSALEDLHRKFVDTEQKYAEYRNAWLKESKKLGFIVEFFPKDTKPVLFLKYHCSAKGQKYEPIHVSSKMADLLNFKSLSSRKKKSSRKSKRKIRKKI